MFESISDSFKSAINKLRFIDDERALKKALDTLKKALLKADVHHKVVKEFIISIESEMKAGKNIGQQELLKAIKTNLLNILDLKGKKQGFVYASKPPTVVLICGLQGSGKTTSTIKLANYLKMRSKKVLIAACDLQRKAAIEQLSQLCAQNEIELFTIDGESDARVVAKNALKRAKEGLFDVLLLDSAGRLSVDELLMKELKDIKTSLNPDEIFYVADAMSGQNALKSASVFNESLELSGVILSKFDADTKGGIALGIAKQLKTPLRFVGVGEKVADFELFLPDRIVNRIMGEGDLASLAEKTATIIDEKQAKRLKAKIKKGEFNFDDFLEQMQSLKKLGSMQSLVSMIPGLAKAAPALKELDLDNSLEIKQIKAMVSSMTKKERQDPKLLNNSRKSRIAKGAGLSQMQVNKFLKQFSNAAKMAKKFSKKGSMDALMQQLQGAKHPH